MTMRIAVLASGGGSNFESLAAHLDWLGARRPADIVLLASDKPNAGALARAKARGIPSRVINPADGGDSLEAVLAESKAELVVLAGYLKLIPERILHTRPGRVVNVHPALLPLFGGRGMYGARVHRAVLDAGARLTGPTVHFVDEQYDHGAIIAQWPVPVFVDDTVDALATRVLRVEHLLYPRAICAVARGKVALGSDGRVRARSPSVPSHAEFMLPQEPDITAIAAAMDALFA